MNISPLERTLIVYQAKHTPLGIGEGPQGTLGFDGPYGIQKRETGSSGNLVELSLLRKGHRDPKTYYAFQAKGSDTLNVFEGKPKPLRLWKALPGSVTV